MESHVAQMAIAVNLVSNTVLTLCLYVLLSLTYRIYVVHDEVKDKNFELELSWIGEGIFTVVD